MIEIGIEFYCRIWSLYGPIYNGLKQNLIPWITQNVLEPINLNTILIIQSNQIT